MSIYNQMSIHCDGDNDGYDEFIVCDWGDFLIVEIQEIDYKEGIDPVRVHKLIIEGEDLPALADYINKAAEGWRKKP